MWRRASVSTDRTHHVLDGRPAYAPRYREVLKFHEPGLSAAVDDTGATHIDLEGRPAYPHRFVRTFGFYEGRAAVHAVDGWVHILPDGSPLYDARYDWCGNYQGERCSVRDADRRYLHLLPDGQPAYADRWRYAGDFRDGIAVVQRGDGLHTHIDLAGALVHGQWFVDLDVFHKGLARARDVSGWTHVDPHGEPVYRRRFANVEPFYNRQARVERFDGGLEVIDERGETLIELRPARRSEFAALSGDLVGFWRTDAIATAVELGVFEVLPASTCDLANRLGLRADRVDALLRALGELALVERRDQTWRCTPRGAYLRRDAPLTLADAALEYAGPLRRLWGALPDAMRGTGWQPPDVFGDVASDPSRVAPHHRMLRSYARHDYPTVPEALGL
ncbi:MAG: methyltransferase dimerization domain-containing protein, partial [Myxococcota bacterium]